ncbi:hypothetical protein BKA59DRAFT_498766 [Fusarium tricinctum]|uniref:Nephrocystin 3-like N-terminal domain-containing protein n=1 Tax=Fusarium tricinctum TaxID=61284 RepID=A0A8K0RZB4_9HYPO|nr:hypothetical protein BKA59DRAFT_498766 [Fusarium tricinctum]
MPSPFFPRASPVFHETTVLLSVKTTSLFTLSHKKVPCVDRGAQHSNAENNLPYGRYSIAWICALYIETAAAQAMLDERHGELPRRPNDNNTYTLGSIKNHNIVIACLPQDQFGNNTAAIVLTDLKRTFLLIRHGLIVGIGGGAPGKLDIRLGDIIVGTRVMQYDFGKVMAGGKIKTIAVPRVPDYSLCTAVTNLRAGHELNSSRQREARRSCELKIHYGGIASKLDIICFEMEAVGLMDVLPCLPIRGICDYLDSYKAKDWQKYAVVVAAAYVREFLEALPATGDALRDSRPNAYFRIWFLKYRDYLEWLDLEKQSQHHGFLWIRGKPGAGKSIIMKFIYIKMKKTDIITGALTVSFFFNARGGLLEKSRILDDPDLIPRNQVRDMIDFFEEVCFSSRYYPYIDIKSGMMLEKAAGVFLWVALSGLLLKGLVDLNIPPINISDASSCIKRFIISSSKGLAEITKAKKPIVQFIYESVCDFLIKDKGLEFPVYNWVCMFNIFEKHKIQKYSEEMLLEKGVDAMAVNKGGRTPLHKVLENGHLEIANMLIKNGTPLHKALRNGHLEIADILLEKGVGARTNGHLEIAKILVKNGADAAAADNNRLTPLHLALRNGHLEIAKILIENGVDAVAVDNDGWTPLHEASGNGHLEIAKMLLEKGTPLHEASENGHLEIVKMLLENRTPLHKASGNGYLEIAKMLIENGADTAAADNDG